jgi:DNA mismatch repair ATPase MutS
MAKKTSLPEQFRRQWHACKLSHPDVLILVGGVGNLTYYTFDEDAERIRAMPHVRTLDAGIVAVGGEYAMAIVKALLENGGKVALADQMGETVPW